MISEPRRIKMESKPKMIHPLGDGTYYYNYDIKEIEVDSESELEDKEIQYSFIQVMLRGQPNYKRCIQAIIRKYLTAESELSLINKYNKYLLGLSEDANTYNDYLDYVNLVSEIQTKVKNDFNVAEDTINPELIPSLKDLINLSKILVQTSNLTDQQALQCKSLYPNWESYIGKSLSQDDKVTYQGKLFKVRQTISQVLENQFPSTDTAALYEEIVEEHTGTLEDPIPYNNNMSLEKDKYYIQNEIKYLCIRSTGQAVYSDLADLVDIYVTVV